MTVKFLHLNMMYEAYYREQIVEFIRKYEFDIIHLQEVAGGTISNGKDNYQFLQEDLPQYQSLFANRFTVDEDPKTYFANVTFFHPSFALKKHEVIWMNPFADIKEPWDTDPAVLPYNAIHASLEKHGKEVDVINTHLSWGPRPDDQPYKIERAKILFDYMKENLKQSFIFSGDFNLTADSQVVQWFNTLGTNITEEDHVTNTLNPRIHKSSHLFPPGLAVDYLYVSHNLIVDKFRVIDDVDLSDHLGIMAEFEL